MINTGVTFGMEGPMMEGTWYNTRTGDSFTVQNSFFEDNEFIVQTTDGRVLKYNQMQDYIKSDKPIEMPKKQTKSDSILLPPEVAGLLEDENYDNMIMEDDLAMIQGQQTLSLGSLTNKVDNLAENPMQVVVSKPVNTNYDIISKALSKRTLPDIQVGIDWLGFPVKEIEMLMDLMDVTEEEIVDWYLDQVDIVTTTAMIKEVIKDYIYRQLHEPVINTTESVEEIKPEPVVNLEKVTSNKKKTTKKK